MSAVLVVDDERGIRAGLSTALARAGHQAVTAANLAEARARLADTAQLDCALLDIRLGDGSGLDLLREMRSGARHRELPVIVATAYDDSERTIEAMRDGAFDYVTKPFDLPRLLDAVERAVRLRRAATAPAASAVAPVDASPLVGRSSAMHDVWKRIGRAAGSMAPVLVRGEAGTGKRTVARAIHDYSPRAAAPFAIVRVDATTDVARLRAALEAAPREASVLVDGVTELDAAAQASLAAFIAAAGAGPRVLANVRVPLDGDVSVLPELYCQLAVIEIPVPPLRERRSDVPLLVSRALTSTRARAISDEAMSALVRYDWPGHVRELSLVVRRAAEMCGGEVIDAHDLPAPVTSGPPSAETPASRYEGLPLREAMARLERDLLTAALRKAEGNRTLAAKLLGIPRPQLYAKLDEHGLGAKRGA